MASRSLIKHVENIPQRPLLHNFPLTGPLLQFQKSKPHDGHDLQYVIITRIISCSESETLSFNLIFITANID